MWYLEGVNLFKIMCPHNYANYKKGHSFENYKKGEFIYSENDKAQNIFLIEKGKVKLGYYTKDGQEIIMAILGRGEIFGEKIILGENQRKEFAQSINNNTFICTTNSIDMENLIRSNQEFSLKIYKFIGFKIKKLERRIQLLLFKDSKTRLIEFIKDLIQDYGRTLVDGSVSIEHPYTQNEIANLIGSARPTINILLKELQNEGLIKIQGKQILIHKKELLLGS